ncbi:hypothetical protein [Chryseobacterium balustinum]|uniref:DUF3945 domain-containing protein n=1 Tax=Chryseobacterium balustinum TaxID=246 RepID=A0AAX2IGB1_9FLAO|nr:hypothetical protein [Chryseobacterium balustinum]AZB28745.1 hypothetical protein EB354_05440 [Chryseobacterium balustinum]SKB85550.1 hypothetical protein SAMN05421800_1113 [Chryseobacterium balustinum]SQA87685.1 Uncharacterised protein [Chryseobacterium balustinum]
MEINLTWFDKNIVPRTKAYKNFVKEIENTSPEQFFRDGERLFTDKEKKFMSIHQSKGREVIIGSNFTLKTIFKSNQGFPIEDKFNTTAELVRFIEKQQLANKQLILQNNRESTEITISNESIKQKFLSDLWAQELEKKTDLSSGLTYTQIDEKQAHHYRNYEVEAAKLSLEVVNQIEKTDLEENADFFSDEGFKENLIPASDLPDGRVWRGYDDGSGSLKSPDGHSYYSYDLQTQEYRLPYGGKEWTGMRDFYNEPQTLHDFKIYAEGDLKEKAVKNNLYPKLSEEEKNDILNYRIYMKENEFILENLQITANQRKAYSEKMEFGTTDGDYSLTQMDTIPNVIDGHTLSKNDKYELAFGLLEIPEYGESYELLDSGEILKIYLEEDSLPKNRILTINEIKFNNQNPNIMENNKEFDQVQYLKDQMKYLGFGEGEKLHKDIEEGIKSAKQDFEIKTTSDKTLPENKVDFTLKFNKSENGGVFLNSYNATLENEKDESISHNFYVNKENTFTAKEAVNLLEGRTVKIEFTNPKTEKLEPAFVKLNFEEPKTEKGNYNFQNFYKNYGVDTAQIIEKSKLIFDKPEWKESTIKSLEKGNIVKVKFELDDKVVEGKAVLNPQYKNLNLYDSDMNRINTNKTLEGLEQDNKHEKNNVKEQSIKR